jgi:hypothetical protein
MIYNVIGNSTFIGFGLMFVFMPLHAYMVAFSNRYQVPQYMTGDIY